MASSGVAREPGSAWSLRWRAPELALVLAERASAAARQPGDEPARSRADTTAVFAACRLGQKLAVAERALTRQGYTVVTAADGDEGLEAVHADGAFDLVVSDVVMPSMDGPAMAREIRKLAPKLPVLFMSGYAEEQLRREIDIEGMHFIAKPFSVQQIAAKVGQVLGASRSG